MVHQTGKAKNKFEEVKISMIFYVSHYLEDWFLGYLLWAVFSSSEHPAGLLFLSSYAAKSSPRGIAL